MSFCLAGFGPRRGYHVQGTSLIRNRVTSLIKIHLIGYYKVTLGSKSSHKRVLPVKFDRLGT